MEKQTNRRTLLKGATAVAAAAMTSKRSTAFAAPAVVQSTGSTVEITYWGSWPGDLGEAEQESSSASTSRSPTSRSTTSSRAPTRRRRRS